MQVIKKKMKFLATKLAALQSEVMVSREILQEASVEVQKMFDQKYFPEIPVEQEDDDSDKEVTEYTDQDGEQNHSQEQSPGNDSMEEASSAAKNADPEVKKMFKKIAAQCHPDKLQDLPDGFEKRKKEEFYNKARVALDNNDIVLMADVASELDVEIPEISSAQLKQTEQKIIAIKNELHQIESTLVWHWFFTEDPEQKDNILKKLFEFMYANNSRP